MKTILAPVDFSAATKHVVAEATALARALEGRVVLLNVTTPIVFVSDFIDPRENAAAITEQEMQAAARRLSALEDKLENEFVHVDSISLAGLPVPLIVEQARKLPADYIVMGSHGHSAFYDLVAGSTTSGVVKRAPCPVIIVPVGRLKHRKTARSLPVVEMEPLATSESPL